jgi:site-specific DNA-methyltransferase (adenine-specific)
MSSLKTTITKTITNVIKNNNSSFFHPSELLFTVRISKRHIYRVVAKYMRSLGWSCKFINRKKYWINPMPEAAPPVRAGKVIDFLPIENIFVPELEESQLLLGDCLEVLPGLQGHSKFALVLTDEPYAMSQFRYDAIIEQPAKWKALLPLVLDQGTIALFSQGKLSPVLINSNPDMYRRMLIWKKNMCNHQNCQLFNSPIHEDILLFHKSARNNYYKEQSLIDGKVPTSVLEFKAPKRQNYLHPTQKPIELLIQLIKQFTLEGEWVLDYTGGSASTAIACMMSGRKYIVIEKDPFFHLIASRRIEHFISTGNDNFILTDFNGNVKKGKISTFLNNMRKQWEELQLRLAA